METSTHWISLSEAKSPLFLGVDVGGTNIKIGLVDDLGRTLWFSKIATDEHLGPQDAMERVKAEVDRMHQLHGTKWALISAVGLGTPGTMDIPSGMILDPPNLPHWRHFPIRDVLAEMCGKPVAFANDANAAAFGEYWIGSGRNYQSLILLTLGTGVGGGVIVNGQLIDGVNSFGSECGHIIIDYTPTARKCVWGGGQGELEAYASASAVVERTREQLREHPDSSLARRQQAGEELTALMVAEEAEAGDALAMQVVLDTATYLGVGIVSLVCVIDPGVVILGGAMDFGGPRSRTGKAFVEQVRSTFKQRAFAVVAEKTAIHFATLGGDAGYIGAAGIARSQFQARSPS